MAPSFAYLAGGRLHVVLSGDPPVELESDFARSVHERTLEIRRRHEWKAKGRGDAFARLLWGGTPWDPGFPAAALTSLTRRPGSSELCYSLVADRLTAICSRRPGSPESERRLLHGSRQRIVDLAFSPEGGRLACAVLHEDGTGSIALMAADATDLTEVTEGDSIDRAPAWAPDGKRIVYQSAGVGRDAVGRPAGLAPSEIHLLDLEKGEVTVLAAADGHDLVAPRLGTEGSLHYMSRPRAAAVGSSLLRSLIDLVLSPFRLLYAVFQYLNFFTARYTGKPLTTAGGPKARGADLRRLLEQSRVAEAAEDAHDAAEGDVPRSWKLVRRGPDGNETVLAAGVSCFDLGPDGTLLFATGARLFAVDPGTGTRAELARGELVSAVVALD